MSKKELAEYYAPKKILGASGVIYSSDWYWVDFQDKTIHHKAKSKKSAGSLTKVLDTFVEYIK